MIKKIPPPKFKRFSKYNFSNLKEYGDFVFIEKENAEKAKIAAYAYARYHKIKVAIRSVEDGINIYHAGKREWQQIGDIAKNIVNDLKGD